MGAYKFSTNYKSVEQRRQAGYSLSDLYYFSAVGREDLRCFERSEATKSERATRRREPGADPQELLVSTESFEW